MENAAPRQRDGKTAAFAFADADRKNLTEALEGLELKGRAAFERDCLCFMMEGWPVYPDATLPSDCFSLTDLVAQVDDVRETVGNDAEANDVLDAIVMLLSTSVATTQ